ncbi:nucleotidyltransferase domain-containing protein [Thermococcus sp.]
MKKREAVEYFSGLLKERYGGRIREIILFGSVARGDAGEESDIDVLVIAEGISQKEISELTWEVLMRTGEVVSAIVESPGEFEEMKDTSFHRTVLREGVRIG